LLLLEKRRNLGDFQTKTKNFKKTAAKLSKISKNKTKKIRIIYKKYGK